MKAKGENDNRVGDGDEMECGVWGTHLLLIFYLMMKMDGRGVLLFNWEDGTLRVRVRWEYFGNFWINYDF